MRINSVLNVQHTDETLALFRSVADVEVPRGGWAQAIRDALGMTNVQLAKRMKGRAPQSVDDLLKSEVARTIKLSSLDELALAMNCRVVYALVPNRPIYTLRQERALTIASEKMKNVFHTMALEGQSIPPKKRAKLVGDFADQLLYTQPRKLWD